MCGVTCEGEGSGIERGGTREGLGLGGAGCVPNEVVALALWLAVVVVVVVVAAAGEGTVGLLV